MKLRCLTAIALAAGLLTSGVALAQQPPAPAAPPDLNAIPDKMPFSQPYGTPITMDRAQALIQAAVAESNKRGWQMNITVVDPNGDLIAFGRMDGAQLALGPDLTAQGAYGGTIPASDCGGVENGIQKCRPQLHLDA